MNSIMEQIKNLALRVVWETRVFESRWCSLHPAPISFSFLLFCAVRRRLPSPAVMKLNLCTELASCTSLKKSGWIKHTLVISQGLEPCHVHINYYRSSICDCPSVALATYWWHSHFTKSYTSACTHWASVLNCPPYHCPNKKFGFSSPSCSHPRIERVFWASRPHSLIIIENNR